MEEIEILKKVALGAGEILKEGFYSKKEVRHKGVVDLITQFDKKSEEFILEELSRYFKDFTLVGEESFSGKRPSGKVIYIDPIDGTTNFVHQLPFFAISIGAFVDEVPLFGVVYNPILDEMFWAVKDKGAFRNETKILVSKEENLQKSLIATGFPYAKFKAQKEYLWSVESIATILPKLQDLRRFGAASLDLCYVASGKFEGFFEIGLNPWDVAAGILIVKEAGGKVSKTNSKEYSLDDFDIVASNGKIHSALIENIKSWDDFRG